MPILPTTPTTSPVPSGVPIIDRRDFLGRSTTLAALALLAGACGDLGSITGPAFDRDLLVTLSEYPDLAAVGGAARITGVGTPLALVHLGEGAFAAVSLVCPHAGATVQWTGGSFRCPSHGAQFSDSGAWTGGHRTSSLKAYPTRYDPVAGTVTISPR